MKIAIIIMSYFCGLMTVICWTAPWLAFYQGFWPQGICILILGCAFCMYTVFFREALEQF